MIDSSAALTATFCVYLLLGLLGFAFLSGLESLWLAGGLLAGTYLNWLLVAKRLRTYRPMTP